MDKESNLIIHSDDLSFFNYFTASYLKNMSIGRVTEAHHDATAVTLKLAQILEIEVEHDNG